MRIKILISLALLQISTISLGEFSEKINFDEGYREEAEIFSGTQDKKVLRYKGEKLFLTEYFYADGTKAEEIEYRDDKEIYRKTDVFATMLENLSFDKKFKKSNWNTQVKDKEIYVRKKDSLGNYYSTVYTRTLFNNVEIREYKQGEAQNFLREWKYGVLVKENEIVRDLERSVFQRDFEIESDYIKISETSNGINRVGIFYFNGNPKRIEIYKKTSDGKVFNEMYDYDEAGTLLSKSVKIGDKRSEERNEKYISEYQELKKGEEYKVFYPNKTVAYERLKKDDNIIEKYYSKEGKLTFEREISSKKISKLINRVEDEVEKSKKLKKELRKIKVYTPKGKPLYSEDWEEDKEKYTLTYKSWYENGQENYDVKEIVYKSSPTSIIDMKKMTSDGKEDYTIYADDKMRIEKNYKNGVLNTEFQIKEEGIIEIEYYTNGKKKIENIVKNSGERKTFYYDLSGKEVK